MANISQVQLPDNSIYDIVPVINPNNTVIDASVHVGPYPLNENSLCMVATDGKLYPFVQTLGTGTGATYNIIPFTIKFKIGTDVFVAGKAYDGSAGAIDVSTLAISEEVDIRYSSRRLTGASGTSYSAIPAGQHNEIYMYIDIQPEQGTFNPICYYMDGYGASGDYIVNILAKEKVKANRFCMFLGYSSSYSTYYKVWLSPEHPIYYCDSERNFIPYDTWRNNIQDTSIGIIDTSIGIIDTSIGIIDTSINIIDGSITNIENTINNLPAPDASLYINKIVDGSIKIDAYPLNENSLCAFTTDNLLCAFVQDATTGTASIVPNTKKFRLGCDILIAGSDYTAGQSAGNVYTLKVSDKVDLRYSETTHTAGTNSSNNTHREMFMPIDISTLSGTFTLKTITKSSNPYNFIQKRSLVSNNFYMYMGYIAAAATSYSFWLDTNHPVYWYDGTNFIPYDTWRNNIQDTSISLIDTSITNIESVISSGSIYFAKTTNNSDHAAILVSIPEVTAYYEGLKIALYYTVSTSSTTSVTLKVNDLTAKRIYAKGNTVLSQGLAVNSINYLCYVGTASDGYFILDRDINTDTNTLTYKNPVAGYNRDINDIVPVGERMFKATDLIKAQLVFEGEDNSIYSIAQSDVSVNPDWGLAYWSAGGRTGSSILPVNNVIQQESLVIADTCIGMDIDLTKRMQYFPVYAWFKYTNNTIKSTVDSSVLHSDIPPATDLSNDTYVYVGTVECVDDQAKYLHMDLSNHDFITLGNRSTSEKNRNITAINGKLLDGGGTSGGNYNNPVSGAGVNPTAAYALQQYDFVCYDISQNGLVPLHCYHDGTLSTSGISYDWGLAFCNAAVAAAGIPPEGSILQQITLDTDNTADKPTHMYMFFDGDGMLIPNESGTAPFPIFSGQASNPPKVSELTPYVPYGKELTQIYIGTWIGNKFHIDLSNHDFITYGTQISQGSNPGVYGPLHTSGPYIAYINGRPFLSASGGGGGGAKVAYGICDDYDMGGVTPRSGSGDGTERGQISGSGPFTLIATTNDRNYTPGESLVSLYLTGIDMYAGAYLQIDNNTAYPIYYEDHAVTRSELESESVATFIFNSSTYYLVAGAAGGDYELTANRVQRVDSSSAYNQYPSARCIYNMMGDIEAALQAI